MKSADDHLMETALGVVEIALGIAGLWGAALSTYIFWVTRKEKKPRNITDRV